MFRLGPVVVMVASLAWAGPRGPSLVLAAERAASDDGTTDFEGWMAQAEAQRAEGEHAAAARSYAAAYRALPEAERAGLAGELAVDNAVTSYRAAHEREPEDLTLLEEPATLLVELVEIRTRAHEAGEAEAVPPLLEQERLRLQARLREAYDERRAASAHAPVEPPPPRVEPEPPPAPTHRKRDVALLASGVVALVGGGALIGNGAWDLVMADREARSRLHALETGAFTDSAQEEYRAELSQWSAQWRGTSTGLIVAGSVLAATGVGLTTWGAVRMRRSGRTPKQRASLGVPMASRDRIGVMVKVEF